MKSKVLVYLPQIAWLLSIAASLVALVAWGESFDWQAGRLSSYLFFPLFGLLAFSIMWSHYISGALRLWTRSGPQRLKRYFEITSSVVLVALMLHPGLLIWQLWRDGLGLPPGSYLRNYVAPNLAWVAMLGTVSFFVFLAFEFRRKFKDRKWWPVVSYANDGAMVAVFYHGLRLGQQLQQGWFRAVWYGYGLTLLLALFYSYLLRFRRPAADQAVLQ